MKSVGKILSACALILTVAGCHAAEPVATIKQEIFVLNESGKTIYGGIYLTDIMGKVLDKNQQAEDISNNRCIKKPITKAQDIKSRIQYYYRLIFSTEKQAVMNKIKNNSSSNVTSTKIEQLSGGDNLYYTVKTGKSLMGKTKLVIKTRMPFTCQDPIEQIQENVEKFAQQVSAKAKKASKWIKSKLSSSTTTTP